nr:hypothetical protein [uncultured Desulfobulbus sp.]
MMKVILLYTAWVSGVLLIVGFLSFAYKFWWSLYALSTLDEHDYSTITCTPFDELPRIKNLCELHSISYKLIYFGRVFGRFLHRKEVF